jgi:exodeoxyribonuclease V alpha subunit
VDRSRDIRTHLLSADKNVFNSSVGVGTGLSLEQQELCVFMDEAEEVVYSFDELDEITHAYAMTAHCSQGQNTRA